jgi:hypothetical protein
MSLDVVPLTEEQASMFDGPADMARFVRWYEDEASDLPKSTWDERRYAAATGGPRLCGCGRPLHYADRRLEEAVEGLSVRRGRYMSVRVGGVAYSVQRHYLMLHGFKAADAPRLVAEGVARVIEVTT